MLLLMRGKVPRVPGYPVPSDRFRRGLSFSALPAGIVEDEHRVSEPRGGGSSMGRSRYEVAPDGDRWVVREGKRATPPLDTKELALDAAVRRAKEDAPAEVVVLDESGAVETERMID
jgi:hypothetical protein